MIETCTSVGASSVSMSSPVIGLVGAGRALRIDCIVSSLMIARSPARRSPASTFTFRKVLLKSSPSTT